MSRLRVAVVFPSFLGGGAEAVCLWTLQALEGCSDLTLVTLSAVRFADLDSYYGTNLAGRGIAVRQLYHHLPNVVRESHSLFVARQHLVMRALKRVPGDFDLVISCFNEMDLGRRGIQFVFFPMFGQGQELVRYLVGHPDSRLRRVYRRLCSYMSAFSQVGMLENRTLAISEWTARVVEDLYGVNCEVIYPPVVVDCDRPAWHDRSEGFVYIARLVPEKEAHRAIAIVRKVRQRGFDVHLHLVAGGADPKYRNWIERKIAAEGPWVTLIEGLTRSQVCAFVSSHRYGLHVRSNEQFGIAIAEMASLGCLPFTQAGGGVNEILGPTSDLLFQDDDDAVDKIVAMLKSPDLQSSAGLTARASALRFSFDSFKSALERIVQEETELSLHG